MTRRTIPARTETFCDRCGVQCCLPNGNHTKQGRLIFSINYTVSPIEYDLCDPCAELTADELEHIMRKGQAG